MVRKLENAVVACGNNGLVQVRSAPRNGWTKAKRAMFLDTLAATCNVTRSAAAAGMVKQGAYDLRRRDPAFAELWRQAREAGYELLEQGLLARAIGDDLADIALGDSGVDPGGDSGRAAGDAGTGPGFDPDLALRVLARRDAAERPGARKPRVHYRQIDIEEIEAALLKRLRAIGKRSKKR